MKFQESYKRRNRTSVPKGVRHRLGKPSRNFLHFPTKGPPPPSPPSPNPNPNHPSHAALRQGLKWLTRKSGFGWAGRTARATSGAPCWTSCPQCPVRISPESPTAAPKKKHYEFPDFLRIMASTISHISGGIKSPTQLNSPPFFNHSPPSIAITSP